MRVSTFTAERIDSIKIEFGNTNVRRRWVLVENQTPWNCFCQAEQRVWPLSCIPASPARYRSFQTGCHVMSSSSMSSSSKSTASNFENPPPPPTSLDLWSQIVAEENQHYDNQIDIVFRRRKPRNDPNNVNSLVTNSSFFLFFTVFYFILGLWNCFCFSFLQKKLPWYSPASKSSEFRWPN